MIPAAGDGRQNRRGLRRALVLQLPEAAAVTGLAFSEDGGSVLADVAGGRARWWSATSGRMERALLRHAGPRERLAVSRSGRVGVSGGGGLSAWLWRLPGAQRLRRFTVARGEIRCLALSAAGELLAAGCEDGAIHVWDAREGALCGTLRAHCGPVTALAYAGDRLLSAGADGALLAWDARTHARRQSMAHGGPVRGMAVSGDGARVAAVATAGGPLAVWEVATGRRAWACSGVGGSPVGAIALDAGGSALAAGHADGAVRIWSAGAGGATCVGSARLGQPLSALAFSPDGARLAAGGVGGRIAIWDICGAHQPQALERG